MLAQWRVSLHRTRADWPIVAAAWFITLLAAVLLAAGPIYSSAVALVGLHRSLAEASVADTTVQASLYAAPSDAEAADQPVTTELQAVIAPLGGTIVRDVRSAGTLAISGAPGAADGDQAIIGFLDALPDHATLVDGSWPVDAGGADPLQVVVVDGVARALGLHVGDQLALAGRRIDNAVDIPVRLVGVFSVDSTTDPYWYGDQRLITGVEDNGSYRTFGPFLTTPADLLHRSGVPSVRMEWRTYPDLASLTVDEAPRFRARLEALPDRLQLAAGAPVAVATGLPDILGAAERSLLVSRTSVLLVMAQLAILAAYAIVLTASLLVDHRRVDTALVRARGAGTAQIALLALAEALLLALPAVLVAPWVAVAALSVLDIAGPLADVGLAVTPQVTADGYLAAVAAGAACVVLLVLPAFLAARDFSTEERGLSRQETRTFGQRLGFDIALLAVTAIALWQLRLYGSPLTRSVSGNLGLDPLLVAAPAIGLLAGGVLALRILPHLAQGLEAVVSRRRDLVGTLGSRQLARRPLRYTRAALLLMIAISMGVFAVSYSATWSGSQLDQAAYQAGADVRVVPSQATGALPRWALPDAYAGLSGVERAAAVERIGGGVSFTGGSADLLAIDADAPELVLFRADESARPLADLVAELRAGRPEPALATLPAGTTYLRVMPRLDLASVQRLVVDPDTSAAHTVALDPAELAGVRVSATVTVRDVHGLVYQVASPPVPMAGPVPEIALPLEPTDDRSAPAVAELSAHLDGPLELAGLGLDVWLPQDAVMATGSVGVAGVSTSGDPDGPWADEALTTGAWAARMSPGNQVLTAVPAAQVQGTTVELTGNPPVGVILGNGDRLRAARLSFVPAEVAALDAAIPVIADRAFLATTASVPGDTITAALDDTTQRLTITGVVDSFPTTDPSRPLLVIDQPTLGLLRLQQAAPARGADEWWMATGDGRSETVASTLRDDPFDSAQVVTFIGRARSLSTDPVALGIIGALAIGFVATGLFAIVGLTVSAAVAARQRRTEFALLRALGLSGGQLSGWLWLENGTLVLVSLLAGTGLGLLLAWMVLPFVTVTQQGTAPVPSVQVEVPWDRILLLDLVSGLALGIAVLAIGAVLRRLGVGSVLRMGQD